MALLRPSCSRDFAGENAYIVVFRRNEVRAVLALAHFPFQAIKRTFVLHGPFPVDLPRVSSGAYNLFVLLSLFSAYSTELGSL